MIRNGEYKSVYYSVKYDKSKESIKDIITIVTEFSTYYKVVVQYDQLIIINIKYLKDDTLVVKLNDVVIVDDFGVRVVKNVTNIDNYSSNVKKEKLTPIQIKMKYEKDTGNKIFSPAYIFLSNTPYNICYYSVRIKEYINWLEEQIMKLPNYD